MADNISDPIVFYVVVKESLQMSPGKIAAQVGHATQHMLMRYFRTQVLKAKIHDDNHFPQTEIDHIKITTDWIARSSTKVILRASDQQWFDLKKEFGKSLFIVRDEGRTEIEPGETVLAFWPQFKSAAPPSLRQLRLL